ncbi:hypothetical protein AB0I37_25115 [Micromonospora purpureochromogenes]|uniref:hypothetical protein n=1 Tax=Micromonospora purpureochromogenes TaxID=47872 RepID=UPI0033FA1C08
MTTTVTSKTSALLADPAQVAVVRALIVHARHVQAEHAAYSFGNGLGQPMGPQEHTFTAGEYRVSYEDGVLRFLAHGAPLLTVHTTDARQVGQLLAAIGVLPERFIGGAK